MDPKPPFGVPTPFKVVDFLLAPELETVLNQSELVLARSGYSTLLDLAILDKKAFFIPTPGQYEQEYLATRSKQLQVAAFETQNKFSLEKLRQTTDYKGSESFSKPKDFKALFEIFYS